jgi:hypothetical protein
MSNVGQEESPDNKKLRDLQDRYLASRSEHDLGAYYVQMAATSLRIIRKMTRKIPGIYSDDDKEERAHNAAVYLVSQYQTRPDFRIKKSITGYLFLRCRKELYYRRKVDGIVTFSSAILETVDKD